MTPTATHGTLVLTSPWARDGITPEDRAEVESHIPDGQYITVAVEPDKSRWILRLCFEGDVVAGPLRVTRRLPRGRVYPLKTAVLYALERWT